MTEHVVLVLVLVVLVVLVVGAGPTSFSDLCSPGTEQHFVSANSTVSKCVSVTLTARL